MELFLEIVHHPVAALFFIVALGAAIGNIKVARVTLGSSGVLFVALLMGNFGVQLPEEFQEFGIILFVYAIGLQAGPRFFNQFRHRGILFAKIAILVIAIGAGVTWIVAWLLELDPALAVGMFAGAMTSTPALAAAMDVSGNVTTSVGFGVAYPFGVIGVVLFVQLIPRLLRIDLGHEENLLRKKDSEEAELHRRQFIVKNPACFGRTLADLKLHEFSEVNVTRISRRGTVMPATRETELENSDIVLAVGRNDELDKLKILLGEEIYGEETLETADVISREVTVSSTDMVGKTLAQLQVRRVHGVVISRVFREDLDFVPTGKYIVELGDLLRVAGSRHDCERFILEAGQQEKRIHETSIVALSVGIFLGVLLAYKEFSLPWGGTFRLGLAGGPLFVSLILAHFGRIGKFNVRIPRPAKYIMQQLGLVLFLAGAGTAAGATLSSVISESGASLFIAGFVVTSFSALAGLLFAYYQFKQDFLTVLGVICGAMTSTPALGVVNEVSSRNEPVLAYTGVYPVALITITVVCQVLYYLL